MAAGLLGLAAPPRFICLTGQTVALILLLLLGLLAWRVLVWWKTLRW